MVTIKDYSHPDVIPLEAYAAFNHWWRTKTAQEQSLKDYARSAFMAGWRNMQLTTGPVAKEE